MAGNSVKIGEQTASIEIFGQVSAADFPTWIVRHAHKLGLRSVRTSLDNACLRVEATGHDEMLTALALACNLGPCSALVDHVTLKLSTAAVVND